MPCETGHLGLDPGGSRRSDNLGKTGGIFPALAYIYLAKKARPFDSVQSRLCAPNVFGGRWALTPVIETVRGVPHLLENGG
jgi:hypothetical protein